MTHEMRQRVLGEVADMLDITFGGTAIRANAVLLHSATGVRQWQTKMAAAQSLLGGVSTGLGVIGSPEFVLAGAVAIGIFEAAVNNANQKKGLQLLREAVEFHERLVLRGAWTPVPDISGIERPNPAAWSSETEIDVEVNVQALGFIERAKVIADYGITKEEVKAGPVVRRRRQPVIFLPDDFVWLKSEAGPVGVRWSAVDSYRLGS